MHRLWSIKIVIALAAVLALGVVSAASASAATQHFYSEAGILPSTQTPVKSHNSGSFELETSIGGVSTLIVCTKQSSTGTALNPSGGGAGEGSSVITFEGCTVSNPAGCTVPNEKIVTNSVSTVAGEKAAEAGVTFNPPASGIFVEVTLQNCSNAGLNRTYPVKGSDFGIARNTTHKLEFTDASSSLTFGGNKAKLRGFSVQETAAGSGLSVKP